MADFKLQFDGYKIKLFDGDIFIKSWDAVSGRPGFQNPSYESVEAIGPLPTGRWTFNTMDIQVISVRDDVVGTVAGGLFRATNNELFHKGAWFGGTVAWGLERVFISPLPGTNTLGRSKFSIHGGDEFGSAGCIDLGHNEVDFFKTLTQLDIGSIVIEVNYDPSLLSLAHPLAGTRLDSGPLSRGPNPTDHLDRPITVLRQCFPAGTKIALSNDCWKAIEQIETNDSVLAFDASNDAGRGLLVSRRVVRCFEGSTDEFIVLRENGRFGELTVTPGHHFLAVDGSFRRIDEILEDDSRIVLADGSVATVTAQRIVYSDDSAHLYEQAQIIEYGSLGGAALKPQVRKSWKTYNFEVEGLHTYIAGGVRVHNDSAFTLAAAADDFADIFGRPFDGSEHDVGLMMGAIIDGEIIAYGDYVSLLGDDRYAAPAYDTIHNKIVTSVTELNAAASIVTNDRVTHITEREIEGGGSVSRDFDAFNAHAWGSRVTGFDAAGNVDYSVEIADNGQVSAAQVNGAAINVGDITGILGSQLGRILGGNSFAGQVAAGTLIGAIGREVGSLVQFGFAGAITDYGAGGQPALIDGAVNGALHEVGGFGGNLLGTAIGQLAAPLIGELAHKLGLSGFGAGVFTSLGTTITAQLVSNAFNVAVLNQPVSGLFAGFNPGAMIANVSGIVGGAIGSYLAAEVVTPVGPEGAFGSSVGSAVGAYFGTILIPVPVLGTAVGSFLGGVIGTLAGNTASGPAEAWGTVRYSADEHRMIAIGFGGNHGGDPVQIANLTHPQVNAVNHLVNWTGAQIDPNSNATHTYHQLAKHFWFQRPDGTTYDRFEVNNPSQQLIPMIDAGVMSMLRSIDLVGGDVLMRRAFETSNAPNPAAFATDLQVADDYRTYLDNAPVINALMAAAPESAFTAGWALTLLKAKEIGLDHGSVNDFRSGIMAQLGTLGVAARLDFAPTFDPDEPDVLVLRHGSGAEWRRDNTFGPGAAGEFAGTAGDNQIHLSGLAMHSIVHASGGAGWNKYGSAGKSDRLRKPQSDRYRLRH